MVECELVKQNIFLLPCLPTVQVHISQEKYTRTQGLKSSDILIFDGNNLFQ